MNSSFKLFVISIALAVCALLTTPAFANAQADTLSAMTLNAYQLIKEGKPEEASRLYRTILTRYADIDAGLKSKRSLMKVYNNLGYLYLFEFHSPERAYPLLLKARDMALQYGQKDLLAAAYDNIAKLYDDFGDTHNALKNFRASLHASMQADTDVAPSIRLMAFDDLANFAIHRELIDSIGESIRLYDRFADMDIPMSRYTRELAHSLKLVNSGKCKEAYATLEKAGALINAAVDTTRYRTNHLLALAALANISGNNSLAIEHLNQGLKAIDSSNASLSDLKVRIYNGLSKILKEEGKENEARTFRLMALEVTDSLYCAKNFGNIRDIESMTFIDQLNKNVELSAMELKHQRRQTWILGISTILVLILFICLGWYTKRLNGTHLELVKRHRESVSQRNVELRIINEYNEKVEALKAENENLQSRLKNPDNDRTDKSPDSYHGKPENTKKIPGNPEEHLQKIEEIKTVFASNPEIYDSSFSLNRLADILGSKPKYISLLINNELNSSFSQLLAEARVAESCRLLLDAEIGQKLTIEAVAEKVGYRSRTHFISIFSKITGLTPSQYLKSSKKSV